MKNIEVAADTLQSILDRNRIQHIDAFLVDCEGADWIVFEQLSNATGPASSRSRSARCRPPKSDRCWSS